jgi:hypothetical protein
LRENVIIFEKNLKITAEVASTLAISFKVLQCCQLIGKTSGEISRDGQQMKGKKTWPYILFPQTEFITFCVHKCYLLLKTFSAKSQERQKIRKIDSSLLLQHPKMKSQISATFVF